jgi:hypothetical protein
MLIGGRFVEPNTEGLPMTDKTDRPRAFQELIALSGETNRPVTRFGRSGRRSPRLLTRRGPMPDPQPAAAESLWQRQGEAEVDVRGADAGSHN